MAILTHGDAKFAVYFAISTAVMNLMMEQPGVAGCLNSTILGAAMDSVYQPPPPSSDRDTKSRCSATRSIRKLAVHICAEVAKCESVVQRWLMAIHAQAIAEPRNLAKMLFLRGAVKCGNLNAQV